MLPKLRGIAHFTGQTHRQGIVAHDRQLKNFAQVPPNKFVLFDLERAEFFEPGSDAPEFHGGCVADLNDLVGSLVAHGYLSTSTDKMFKDELAANVLTSYLEVNLSEHVLDAWDKIVDDAMLERSRNGFEVVGGALGHVAVAGIGSQPIGA